jgi:hypothetical protein
LHAGPENGPLPAGGPLGLAPLFYWSGSTSVGALMQLDQRRIPGGCGTYAGVTAIPGPLYGDPKWNIGYKIPAPSFKWAAGGGGSRTLVCIASRYVRQGSGVNTWEFKGAREAYVKLTYFPYSQLPQYERSLAGQRGDAFTSFPTGFRIAPFTDLQRAPSTPFGPNNPSDGCHSG